MASITTINASDQITDSRTVINTNFSNLNSDKIETSVIDTDTTLAANSDSKIPSQKAVKAYVDAGGNANASETAKGIVEEATDAEVAAGTATGGTGAKLFVTPAKLLSLSSLTLTTYQEFAGATTPVPMFVNANGYAQVSDANLSGAANFIGFCNTTVSGISPTFVNATTGTNNSFSVVCNAGTNRYLIVQIAYKLGTGSDVTAVTWGGTAMTQLQENITGTAGIQSVWGLAIGTSGSNQSNTLSITSDLSGGSFRVIAATYNYVNQTTPVGSSQKATGASVTPSATITPSYVPSRIVQCVSAFADTNSITWNDGQTTDSSETSSATIGVFMGSVLWKQTSSNAFDATIGSTDWCTAVIELQGTTSSISVKYAGLQSGFTGLTKGGVYKVTDTEGTISTSAGTTTVLCGKAVSATKLLILQGNP